MIVEFQIRFKLPDELIYAGVNDEDALESVTRALDNRTLVFDDHRIKMDVIEARLVTVH